MGRKNVIGLIAEFETSKGVAYSLCTHEEREHGPLVYLYPIGTLLSELKDTTPQFCCFCRLRALLRRKTWKEVGKMEIPLQLKDFPVFRVGLALTPGSPKVACWWFWDGEKEWPVGEITDEQRKMPIRSIWGEILITERLEEGYTAEKHPLI